MPSSVPLPLAVMEDHAAGDIQCRMINGEIVLSLHLCDVCGCGEELSGKHYLVRARVGALRVKELVE